MSAGSQTAISFLQLLNVNIQQHSCSCFRKLKNSVTLQYCYVYPVGRNQERFFCNYFIFSTSILISFLPVKGHTSVHTLLESYESKMSCSALIIQGSVWKFCVIPGVKMARPFPIRSQSCPNNQGAEVGASCHFGFGSQRLCLLSQNLLVLLSSGDTLFRIVLLFRNCLFFFQSLGLGDIPCAPASKKLGSRLWGLRGMMMSIEFKGSWPLQYLKTFSGILEDKHYCEVFTINSSLNVLHVVSAHKKSSLKYFHIIVLYGIYFQTRKR